MILSAFAVNAQIDTIVLFNGDILVGEIKKMNNNILQIETDYSDSDFKVEWDKVAHIYTSTFYLVNLKDGSRLNGIVRSSTVDSNQVIIKSGDSIRISTVSDIIYLHSVKQKIWSRFDALLEIGFNITKANNLKQFNSRTAFGYTANTWAASLSYNAVYSNQDSVQGIRRTDAAISANWFLNNNWFVLAAANFLSNDEQKLDLRATPKLGFGNFLARNNKWYFAASAGLAMNIESFQNDTPDRSSLEGFVGVDTKLFNFGDLSLSTNVVVYPSITESGRIRTDFTIDLKYDFFDDFYIKLGTTFNYDNKPADGASSTDYVFQTTVGWEL